MFAKFLSLEWKSFFRSASLGKSIGLRVLLIFLALYFSAMFLLLGFRLYPLLKEFYPNQDPLRIVNQYILVYFALELIFRFLLQTLPVIDIKPFLNLPIPKRKVVNFVLAKSLYSFYNFLPLLIIIPFGIICIHESDYGITNILGWMLTLISLSLCVNFINFIIKRKFTDNLKALIPFVFIIVILVLLDYLEMFQLRILFGEALKFVIVQPYLAIIPILSLIMLYKWNQYNLENRFYLDANLQGKQKVANTQDFVWTRKFGSIAPFLQQDLKLIWRNKRPKTTIYLSFIFLAYGLIFYPNDAYDSMPAFFVFVGIFITGIFMINFGQFVPAWDASYYPMMMAQNIPLKQYLASKAGLLSFSVVVLAILSTPYVYFGWDILLMNMVCALYNLGVNIPVLLYAGSFNKKKIDLDKSPFMNYQGTGATQWLVGLPLILLPVLLFWIANYFLGYEAGLIVLAGLGVIGLLMRGNLLETISRVYRRKKYAMIQGFKQDGE